MSAVAAVGVAVAGPSAAAAPPSSRAAAVDAAVRNLAAHPEVAGTPSEQGFSVRDVVLDRNGKQHVRLSRSYRGLPVLGGDVVVHNGRDGSLELVSRTFSGDIRVGTAPAVSPSRATAAAVSAFAGRRGSVGRPSLAVYARDARPSLAWQVTVRGVRSDGTPSELRVVVDATTGTVLETDDAVETATGSGRSFFNGTVSLETTLSGSSYQLKDPTRGNTYTTDRNNGTDVVFFNAGTLFTDADNAWGDGTLGNRQTVAVDAQYGTNKTWDYYLNVHGRRGIAGDGKGSFSRVHYGRNYNNAFWSDSCFCMTYGDGDGTNYNPFDSLDVAGHEMSHGVTSRTAGLTYSGESGGLNEATSDIFGTLVEFYANNANDPGDFLIGERLSKNGQPLRYMDKPSKDGSSADCWSATVGTKDVHYSSGVANHFFFLMANGSGASAYGNSPTCNGSSVSGIGRDAGGKIWYRALTVYMTSGTNYAGARSATLNAASDLYGSGSAQYAAVAASWAAVNVS